MKTIMMGTLAAMAMGAGIVSGTASAAVLPLQNSIITASYNGQATGVLGVEHNFQAEPGSNISSIDPNGFEEPEFITADYQFIVDFSASGLLTVYNNSGVTADAHNLRFDFGNTLALALTSFSLVDTSAIGGLPLLTLIDGHTVGLDLSGVEWRADFSSFSAQLDALAPAAVPEPATGALLLAGLSGLALARRKQRAQGTAN